MMRDMKIAMSGATGFIGGHLTNAFEGKGWRVVPLRRDDLEGNGTALLQEVEGADVVINLAGASIAARWTEEYKKIMYGSRIETTRKIVDALGKTEKKPDLFISTSAVGIYDTKGAYTEEDARYADDFLGKLALDWEQEALGAKDRGIRTVIFRFGVVLGPDGGALKEMLIPFRLGLGGVIGHGTQSFSWVHIEDLLRAFFAAIENKNFEGIYNLTAPNPTTNRGLTEALGHALHRPAVMRVPAFVFRLQLGEGAKVLLEGQRVFPKRLQESGFTFMFTEIEKAIEDLVKRDN
jgi:uncharacterized protein (TIGR01777 family)